MNFLRVVLTLIISGSIWLLPHSRSLAAFPEKQLTIIVPYTAGGATDVLARIVATNMSALLGQAVVVENRPGASGSIGTRHVATAEPDGYTLLIANTLAHTASPALMKTNFGYDAVKSFRAVGFIGTNDYVLVVNPQFPAKTVGELVEVARANPGKYSFGSAGTGTSTHLAPALFLRAAGLELKHIPYKGTVVN
ncbi:MAG: Bug family tripartite tricarboxylate transporter substrate binding protein, partial [Burkholderiaceae bacterium]